MKRLAALLILVVSGLARAATTAPINATTVAPVAGAQCTVNITPQNMYLMDGAAGALYRCNPTPSGSPSVTRWQVWVLGGTGSDGTYGLMTDINTSAIENPPGNKATFGWYGSPAQPGYRRSGENTYSALWTNGGVYGPITCTTGTCTLNTGAVNGTHIALTGQVTNDLMYFNGTNWVVIHKGTSNQVLAMDGTAANIVWTGSTTGGDSIKINGVDFTGAAANFLGAGESSGDMMVRLCTGAGAPVANCAAANDVVWNFVNEVIVDSDVNNFAGIQLRKVAGSGTSNFAGVYGGDPALMTTDTGNALCGDSIINKTCVTTFVETTGVEQACTFTHTVKFRAWCK